MKALFTGVGSIGSRHVENLRKVCDEKGIDCKIDVLRYSSRKLSKEVRDNIRNEVYKESELDTHYDCVFITDETYTHFGNIKKYKKICDAMFIEKPIFDRTDYDIQEIFESGIYYVAAPIRFTKYYQLIKEYVAKDDIYAARIIFSSYMPNWQKGRDYRKSFRCYDRRGGGVDCDSIHEIDYMVSLFGKPKEIKRIEGKYSNLEMESCDIATYLFDYGNKVIEMHLDYFGRVNNRRIELMGKEDVISIDFNKKEYVEQLSGISGKFGPDDTFYYDEMKYFVELSMGMQENINPPEMAYETLKIAKGII